MEGVTLAFTTVPKRGRVFAITRKLEFPQGKQPAKADMTQSLIEKYGTPLMLNDLMMMWSYDSQGKLLEAPAPGTQANQQFLCIKHHVDALTPGAVVLSTSASDGKMHWNITQPAIQALRYQPGSPHSRLTAAKTWESACGAIVVLATLQASGPLLHGLDVRIAAPDMVPPSQVLAQALIDAAQKAEESTQVDAAKKNKPAL